MTKSTRIRKRNNHSGRSATRGDAPPPNEGRKLFSSPVLPPTASAFIRGAWFSFSLVSFLVAILPPIYFIFINPSFFSKAIHQIPAGMNNFLFTIFTVTLLTFFVFLVYRLKTKSRSQSDRHFAWKLRRVEILIDWVGATIYIVIIFYGLGLIDKIAYYFSSTFPGFGKQLSYAVSTVLGWVVSGVIGNAAYDFLKKIGGLAVKKQESGQK